MIFAILLMSALLPAFFCAVDASYEISFSEQKISEDSSLLSSYSQEYQSFLSDMHIISSSAKAFTVYVFIGIVSASVIFFVTQRRSYGCLLSGVIVFTVILWAEANKILIHCLKDYEIGFHLVAANAVYQQKGYPAPYGIFGAPQDYSVIQTLLLLTALGLLIIALVQFIQSKKDFLSNKNGAGSFNIDIICANR